MNTTDLIRQGVSILWQPGDVYEIRIPDKFSKTSTYVGYFNDPEQAVKAVCQHDGKHAGIYRTLNPVLPDLMGRANNRLLKSSAATVDDQILRRRLILIDVDAERKVKDISTSDAEKANVFSCIEAIADYLKELGIRFISADSGNGAHLLIPVDLPNDEDSKILVGRFLRALSYQFDTEYAGLDTKVFNASRINKLYGTMACKGENMPDRPHRRSALLEELPSKYEPVDAELLRAVASVAPEEAKMPSKKQYDTPEDAYKKAGAALDVLAAYRKDDRTYWRNVGMALSELGSEGYSLWDNWSQGSGKYDARVQEQQWRSFKPGNGITLATLFGYADQDSASWREPFKNNKPKPEIRVDNNLLFKEKAASVALHSRPGIQLLRFNDVAREAHDQAIAWANDPRDVRGFSSNIPLLDLKTGGFDKGYMASLIGPTGSGKSTAVVQFVFEFQKQAAVLLVPTELRPTIMAHRMACQIAGVYYLDIRRGKYTPAVKKAYEQLYEMNIQILPESKPSAKRVEEAAFCLMELTENLIVVVDSGSNLKGDGNAGTDIYNTTRSASSILANIAYEGAFVFATWQTGRSAKYRITKDVALSDIKGAGEVEADSAYVLGWDRPYYWYEIGELKEAPEESPNYTALRLLKNRDGERSLIELNFVPGRGISQWKGDKKTPDQSTQIPKDNFKQRELLR